MHKGQYRDCETCGKEFFAEKRYIKRGHAKFCSLKCSSSRSRQPKKSNVTCAFCNKDFYLRPSKVSLSKSGLHFCSRKHKDAAQRIGGIEAIQPNHYGKGINNYRKRALAHYPNQCNRCGYDKFIQALVIHHIDHDRENNDISNLEVLCPTCHWEHHLGLT